MKKLKSFDDYMAEGELPDWAKPSGDIGQMDFLATNFQDYRDKKQSMTNFQVGDVVMCEKHTATCHGKVGTITSMEGVRLITFQTVEGETFEIEPQYLRKVEGQNIVE